MRNPVSIRGVRNPITLRGTKNPVTILGTKNPVTIGGVRNPVTIVGPGLFDSDASDFFSRASITDPIQQNALNQLVGDLKTANLWNSISAIYPYVGGTAASHAQNLKSSSFTITWVGGVTHDANGITGNGTTGYGDTGLKPGDLGINGGFGDYLRSLPVGDNNTSGVADAGGTDQYLINYDVTSNQKYGCYGASVIAIQATAVATGMYSINRLSATNLRLDLNGSSIGTSVTNTVPALPAFNFFILARNVGGTPQNFSEAGSALNVYGQGLSSSDSLALYNAVQTFQTTLGRQI